MPVEKGTISIRLVAEALAEPTAQGLDAVPLLRAAGIDPHLLARPYARVSSQAYSRLWLDLARQTDDEFFGLNARRMKAGSFSFMAHAALREPTLGEALRTALRFLRVVFDDLAPRLASQDGIAAIQIDELGPPRRAFCYFSLWLMVHGLACWLIGRRIPVLAVELRCAAPD
ncbi:MAG: hypothetical protein GAK45_01521 [Pseudomonas citronellolis]|nr:MAG: hypothetical protein GAK45_01521 [Pseudomonas citronellolis]